MDYQPTDFTDPQLLGEGIPHAAFAAARRTAPVHFVEQPPEARAGFPGRGYWAITKHADVLSVSKNSKVFSAWENGAVIRLPSDITREQVELNRLVPLSQDDPQHAQHRAIVSRGFTPRSVRDLEGDIEAHARSIVLAARDQGAGDFVTQVAAELPLMAIAQLLGVPLEDRGKLFEWSNKMMGYDEAPEESETAKVEFFLYFMDMAAARLAEPRNDIVTKLVMAEHGGEAMSSEQFGYFCTLLVIAGNETTRNAITRGVIAFTQHPDQWELFKRERPATTADEIIRWSSPVNAFQRTALADIEVGGQQIAAGDRVGLFYASANFDEDVFERPHEFDILRDPNPHLAFGGHGPHFCIGANLARLEVSTMMKAIADHMPDITPLSEPVLQQHSWVNGVTEWPVQYVGA